MSVIEFRIIGTFKKSWIKKCFNLFENDWILNMFRNEWIPMQEVKEKMLLMLNVKGEIFADE